jgi:Tol biopolymer transport system component
MTISRRRLLASSAFLAAGTLSGRPSRTIAQSGTPPGAILFARSGNIWRWRNGDTAVLFEDGAASEPRWSPDGGQVLFVRTGFSFSDLYVRTLFDNSEVQLTYNEVFGYAPGSAEYAANSIWVQDPCWSPAGTIAYASDYFTPYGVLALWVMSVPGATPTLYLGDPPDQSISGVSLSDDGSVAAYTSRILSDSTGEYVSFVAVQDLGTLESRALINEPEGAFDPALEPGGMRVAAAVRQGGVSDIWLYDRSGAEPLRVTTNANATQPCWLSDGSWLAYMQMVDFEFQVHAVPVNGTTIGEPVSLFGFDDIDSTSGLSWTLRV